MKNIHSHSRSHKPRRMFLISFSITLTLAIVLFGMVTADYSCRSTALGDTVPPFQVERLSDGSATLKVHTMGLETELDVSAGIYAWDFVREFLCLPAEDAEAK